MKRGKKYREAKAKLKAASYTKEEAVKLAKETTTTKFDATIELHINCNVDLKQADQTIRSTIALPNGTGKSKTIAAFVSEDKLEEAKKAGADFVGSEDLVAKVEKEKWTDFDIAIATPDMMRFMAKIGKILGTKGLMPNPKTGTVTSSVGATIKEIKGGRQEFKTDPQGVIHMIIGKVSFSEEQLKENLDTALEAVRSVKPASIKGSFIKTITLTTSMGPGIPLKLSNT